MEQKNSLYDPNRNGRRLLQLPPDLSDFRDKTVYFGTVPLGQANPLAQQSQSTPSSLHLADATKRPSVPALYNTAPPRRTISEKDAAIEEYSVPPEDLDSVYEQPSNGNPSQKEEMVMLPKQDDLQPVDEVPEVQAKFQLKVQRKKKRPRLERQPPKRQEDGTEVDATYAGKLHENIRLFFQYNEDNLVRSQIHVDESEKTKARSWVFLLLFLQIGLSVVYAYAVTTWIDTQVVLIFIACAMAFLFGFKIISLIIFLIRRAKRRCVEKDFDMESGEFDDIFICIPAYNEDIAAFSRTISSICNSYYPRNKMYMLFIVDGNKDGSFENLMEVLLDGKPFEDVVEKGVQRLEQGVYRGVNYSVYLKDANRGKRDSQWLFVEIMRNMIPTFKPPFCFFVDSDTAFDPHSIRYLHQACKSDDKIAGVCGRLALSNWELKKPSLDCVFSISTLFIVGFQQYEYYFNQIIGKQSEAAYYSVTCLPGAFSMLRTSVLCNIEARYDDTTNTAGKQSQTDDGAIDSKMDAMQFMYLNRVKNTLPLVLDDFFSRPTIGIVARNLYELGEDRTLTVKMLEKGLKTTYEPRAVAYTECPDTIGKLIQQRRRWNNSTFVNLAVMLTSRTLWFQWKTFPVMIFTTFDLFGSYFLPVNAILFVTQIWDPFFSDLSIVFGLGFTLNARTFLACWLALQLLIMVMSKMPENEMYFILSTFISGLVMLGSLYYIGRLVFYEVISSFRADPASSWPVLVISYIFPLLHLICSVTNPPMFLTMIFFLIMFPTVIITIPLYAFLKLDDFSWGTRD
eukprot:TRINITY_DN3137_c0_g1_i1.p1 TRINITY_DN3137_c0_g1~~TRINITY_DN3137_c0_g1_i1.p1  ORF type:complete len:794 (-),score=191.04 TRINITY_DN3137_c0_g1_i1:1423-3804(-)